MDTDSRDTTIRELREENASIRARVQSLCDREAALKAMVETLMAQTRELQARLDPAGETIARLQRMVFGSRTERIVLSTGGSPLLPGFERMMGEAAGKDEPAKDGSAKDGAVGRGGRHRGQPAAGWNEFPPDLPRETVVIELPPERREGLRLVGHAESERLVHRWECVVQLVRHARHVRADSPRSGVVTAPAPRVAACVAPDSDRCRYDLSVLVHVIAARLQLHLPFHRQSAALARMGVRHGRSAMCGHFARVSEALRPPHGHMVSLILACPVLHADETGVRMLPSEEEGRAVTCRVRVRRTGLGPPMTAFHFSRDRSMGAARAILGDCHGTVIRDGCAGHGGLPADVACRRAHCRRKFVEARGSHPELADRAIALIRGLHAIEAAAGAEVEARADGAGSPLTKARRRHRRGAVPLADECFAHCRAVTAGQPPSSPVARAAAHSPDREAELRRHLADPRLNIDSNPCENVIRPLCLGRRNWLFVGSGGGGVPMAVLAGLAATCRENGVDFGEWLPDVLPRPDTHPAARIGEPLPHEWGNRRDAPAEPAD